MFLTSGLVVTLLAPALTAAGYVERLTTASRYGGGGGSVLVWVGALLTVLGVALLAVGVHRLAEHVDRLGGVRYLLSGAAAPIDPDEAERQARARRALAGE